MIKYIHVSSDIAKCNRTICTQCTLYYASACSKRMRKFWTCWMCSCQFSHNSHINLTKVQKLRFHRKIDLTFTALTNNNNLIFKIAPKRVKILWSNFMAKYDVILPNLLFIFYFFVNGVAFYLCIYMVDYVTSKHNINLWTQARTRITISHFLDSKQSIITVS